mgnify:CR=1 FL=1
MGALKADKGNGLDYLYHQRNDRDTFIRYGEFMQSGDAEVCFTENEANTSLLPSREVEYSDEEEAPAPVNKGWPSASVRRKRRSAPLFWPTCCSFP